MSLLRLLQLLLRQLLHVRVGQHFGRVRERALCLLVFAERGDDRLKLVALAQQLAARSGSSYKSGAESRISSSSSRAAKTFSFSNIFYLQNV